MFGKCGRPQADTRFLQDAAISVQIHIIISSYSFSFFTKGKQSSLAMDKLWHTSGFH